MTFFKRLLIASAAVVLAGSAHAQTFSDAFAGFGSNDGEPIEIEASELRVEDGNNTATFVGDVVVTQGETSLKTERLKVFYVGSGAKTQESAVQQRISKLEAAGGVFITSKDQTARGDAASFDMNTEFMVMTGREVVLSQGPNVVVGNKLTVNLKTGQANLTAGGGKVGGQGDGGRVKVRIQPNSVNNGSTGN
ncbi:LptA/OstA family protein [Roseibium sp. M-1]